LRSAPKGDTLIFRLDYEFLWRQAACRRSDLVTGAGCRFSTPEAECDTMNQDSYQAMLDAVQAFHDKHDFKNTGGEDLAYRVALMAEELGEISACVTKGKAVDQLAEECADLFILVIGTAIAEDFDLRQAFWDKMDKLMKREARMVNGRIRVSEFRDV